MSEEADSVAISRGEDARLEDSGEAILLGDSVRPREKAITIDHGPHKSIDELLKVIKGANGMPVLFVPTIDGRLVAVAVDGLQNMLPANRDKNGSGENTDQDFRAWLLFLTSLVATVTFTAGLTPPGGFWAADDKANGYVAGTSVMRDKFNYRYRMFQCSNTLAFFSSLTIIGMLAKSINVKEDRSTSKILIRLLVGFCFLCLGTSYITGTWDSLAKGGVFAIFLFVSVFFYMAVPWVWGFLTKKQHGS
uniref:PGG domain-containing protein n=1 Tax=Hordeum vulgare subsp. vulgare TaxID=112509 RepID=A0A8I6Y930_HORVV